MKTLEELNQRIERWAHERKLDKEATKEAQSVKTAEEFAELIIGISKNKEDLIKDSIGDVYVTILVGNLVQNKVDLLEIYKKKWRKTSRLLETLFKNLIKETWLKQLHLA